MVVGNFSSLQQHILFIRGGNGERVVGEALRKGNNAEQEGATVRMDTPNHNHNGQLYTGT